MSAGCAFFKSAGASLGSEVAAAAPPRLGELLGEEEEDDDGEEEEEEEEEEGERLRLLLLSTLLGNFKPKNVKSAPTAGSTRHLVTSAERVRGDN